MKYQKELTNKLRTDTVYPITVLNAIRLTDEGEGLLSDLLNNKVDKDGAKVLSTNDYTTAEKTKLFGIEAGADVNQNAFSVIKVTGQPDIPAEHEMENLTFVAGSNVTITTNSSNKTISIAATNTTANDVTFTPTGNLSSTNVQTALAELDTEKASKLFATNLVTNGDFSLDTNADGLADGFSISTNTIYTKSLVNNVQRIDVSSGGYFVLINGNISSVTDIIYLRCFVRTNLLNIKLAIGNSAIKTNVLNDGNWAMYSVRSIKGNRYSPEVLSDSMGVGYLETKYWTSINLTATFGAGNEPTKEQMDRLLSTYPNSWFDGTNEIVNIKQLFNEKSNKLMATNLVTNGDFSDGTTGWTGAYGSISVSNNELTYTTATPSVSARINKPDKIPNFISGNVYYARFMAYSPISNSVRIYLGDGFTEIKVLSAGVWTPISGIKTVSTNTELGFYISTEGASVGDIRKYKYASVINLTATFGAGKEPTKEQMDWLLAQKYTNSWFDGTKELTSITDLLTLVNTKANITQEAWITPTLQSGWLEYGAGFETVRYMKDQFGFVHLKGLLKSGTVGVVCMNLPAGYRPSVTQHIATASNNAFGFVTINNLGVVAITSGSNVWFSLNNITFKAEA